MKNSSISKQLELQKQNFAGENKKEVVQFSEKVNNLSCNLDNKKDNKHSYNQQNDTSENSLLYIISLGDSNNYDATLAKKLQAKKLKKKKRHRL